MTISNNRWIEAQKFEEGEWATQKDATKLERLEGEEKFIPYFDLVKMDLPTDNKSMILDVGCGPTCLSSLINPGIHKGIDPLAQKLGYEGNCFGVEVVSGMAESLPWDEGTFDLVICINMIDHTLNPDQVLAEIKRVLKKDGHLIIACYVYTPFVSWVKRIGEMIYYFRNLGHPYTYSPKQFTSLIRKHFKVNRTHIIHEGQSPYEFGKKGHIEIKQNYLFDVILWFNRNIFRNKWFVREISLLCTQR